jgi:hypothetical protein
MKAVEGGVGLCLVERKRELGGGGAGTKLDKIVQRISELLMVKAL